MKVCILLGSAHVGGGTYVIFQHALWLQRQGWDVVIVPYFEFTSESAKWHPEAHAELKLATFEEVANETFDLCLATWWRTVYDLHKIGASRYGYFVQSIESRFFPEHEVPSRTLADASYLFNLPTVTEATWIQTYLAHHYGTQAHLVPNGIRKDIYSVEGNRYAHHESGKLRVLVEGTMGVFFKNVERTIELCQLSKADEVWLLTSSPGITSFPGCDRVFSCVPLEEAASLYRSCDVLVKLSYVEGMFGPPLEMFHCGGTSIVYEVTGHEEYMHDQINSFIIKKDDEEGVIRAINLLKDCPGELARLRLGAIETASQWPAWDYSSSLFQGALLQMQRQPSETQESLRAKALHHLTVFELQQKQAQQLHSATTELISLDSQLSELRQQVEIIPQLRHHESQLHMVLNSRSFKLCQTVRRFLQ